MSGNGMPDALQYSSAVDPSTASWGLGPVHDVIEGGTEKKTRAENNMHESTADASVSESVPPIILDLQVLQDWISKFGFTNFSKLCTQVCVQK